ncbi:hypothetical protein [Corynebacterium aurimucosum]|uniref:hypothetical protein n=1 Tax=Corynebacterium aurimucosum TaxID=169292 RepID=UPI000C7F9906|nr:hypothetical protein [Corynebacterium aurimucosum]PMC71631.1 hypothetical protein CJ201_03105 [Corynebacterium aurimucosum]
MADSTPRTPRARRRVKRPSTAENYDRSFDVPHGPMSGAAGSSSAAGADELRTVSFEADAGGPGGDSEDEATGEAFYRENMPPHFGTTQ